MSKPNGTLSQAGVKSDTRLTPIGDMRPWRHAPSFTGCFLYWIPVSRFPVPVTQRRWLLRFFDIFADTLERELQLDSEIFVQLRTIVENSDLHRDFLNHSMDLRPLIGYARAPHAEIPPATLTQAELDAFSRPDTRPSIYEHLPDYCYWFVNRSGQLHRRLFLGQGGMTHLFLARDSKTQLPDAFQQGLKRISRSRMLQPLREQLDIDKEVKSTASLGRDFLQKSKAVFGAGMKRDLHYFGLQYIIPLLRSRDFFETPLEAVRSWFDVFEIYIQESPADGGILLASKTNLESVLVSSVEALKAQAILYLEH